MGGAIGTPLLLLVILLLTVLMCMIKRNGSKPDNDEIVMHSNEIYNMESKISDEGQKTSMLNSPQNRPSETGLNDIEEFNIYASVQ